MKFLKKNSFPLLFLLCFALFGAGKINSAHAAANAVRNFGNSANATALNAGLATQEQADDAIFFEKSLGGIVNAILNFLGIAFLLLTIYGGIIWMTAAGNENKIEKAKKIIISSVIGLSIIILAKVIAFFIIDIIIPQ